MLTQATGSSPREVTDETAEHRQEEGDADSE
jgi:hypothetical protein